MYIYCVRRVDMHDKACHARKLIMSRIEMSDVSRRSWVRATFESRHTNVAHTQLLRLQHNSFLIRMSYVPSFE